MDVLLDGVFRRRCFDFFKYVWLNLNNLGNFQVWKCPDMRTVSMFVSNLRRTKAETLLCGSRAAPMCNRVSTHVNTGAGWRLMEALLSLQQVEGEEGPTDGAKPGGAALWIRWSCLWSGCSDTLLSGLQHALFVKRSPSFWAGGAELHSNLTRLPVGPRLNVDPSFSVVALCL